VTLVALAAFGLHAPSHPLASRFAESARALALSAAPPALRLTAGATWLLHANWWYGAFERSQPVVDAVAPLARARDAEPSAAIHWLTMEAPHWAALGDEAGAARCAAEARAIADATGIRSWDLILEVQALWGAFRVDDLAAARAHLSALRGHARPGHATDASFVAVYEALLALRSGAAADALRRAGEAIALAERVRYAIPLVMGELLRFQASSRLGDAIEAGRSRARAAPHLAALQSPCFDQLVALLDADHLLRVGDSAGALVALRRALAFGAAGISHARYFLSPPALATLLAAAVDAGVERHAALRLAQAQSLPAPHGAGEQWPRALRVRVMGEGAIERHGLAVARAPRAPRRPLELLHALIALGGHDVPKMTLAEALWPDADGDVAHHALETTLYRLRQLVGPEVVAQRNGRLSIDQQRCWVDLLELDERVTRALAALRTGGPGAVPGGELRRIEALLTGLPFAKDGEAAWAVAARDRLRGRLARLLEPLSAAGTAPGLAALLDRIAELDGGPSPARLRLVPGGSDGQPAA
jgi:DNA-binding SARP family transcriptional activator